MSRKRASVLVLASVFAARTGWSDDRWEHPSFFPTSDDDSVATANELWHGARQTHDIQGVPAGSQPTDRDFMAVETKAGHSYEVRVFSTNLRFQTPLCKLCSDVDRVDGAGNVLTEGFPPNGSGPIVPQISHSHVVRWIGTSDQRDWIRVTGDLTSTMTANDQYEIEMLDTTYFVPRWNQSGTQFTVLLVQNTSPTPVTGNILFYDAGGAVLHVEPLNVPVHGVQVVQGGAIGALAGQSGSAAIVHTGGYGALGGKAVALEPATGFTFDTPIVPVPR
jgi:hypothetical protein